MSEPGKKHFEDLLPGELDFYDGMPANETLKKVYDNLDFMQGVEVFLNFIPEHGQA